jgi:hypothetical protein
VHDSRLHRIARKLSPGLIVVAADDGDRLWTRGKARTPRECALCGGAIAVGSMAFRPLGNVAYRYLRIHGEHADRIEQEDA